MAGVTESGGSAQRGGPSIASVLRESAIILAAITGLLYVASALYGYFYLDTFGLPMGFHALGVGELSMLGTKILFVGGVCVLIYVTLGMMGTDRVKRLVLCMFTIAVISQLSLIPKLVYGVSLEALDWVSIFPGAIFILGTVATHVLLRIRAKHLKVPLVGTMGIIAQRRATAEAQFAQHRAEVQRLQEALSDAEARVEDLKKQFVRPNAEQQLASAEKHVDSVRADRSAALAVLASDSGTLNDIAFLERLLAHRRMLHWLAAAYGAAIFVIPAAARIDAVAAAAGEHWEHGAGERDRTPVYWVGDRYVYITSDKTGCHVHATIGSNVAVTRRCPPLIEAIEP